jgi:hypothetical protein
MYFNTVANSHYMGLGDLICLYGYLKFVETRGPDNEGFISDNITRDRKGTHQAQEDCQGVALVAQG